MFYRSRKLKSDVRLKPMERNAWMVLCSLANSNGVATVSYESLRTALLCAPGSQKAAPATVSRAVLCLRLTAWIDQTGCRRDPRTGFSRGASYTVRTEPLSFTEACLGNEDYLPLLEQGLEHRHATLRKLARDILDQAMRHSDELAQLPPALQEEVKRLHQKAHASVGGSSGGSASCGGEKSDQHLSSPAPTFPKSTSKTPATVRTVQNNGYKVPTYHTPQAETPRAAMARFRQLAADQQDYLSGHLQALPVEQRRDVLAEWDVRCALGKVRDAAAYLFGLIRKALQGTFRLWAARKKTEPEQPASNAQKAPREISKSPSTSGVTTTEPADKPASREVALASIQRMWAILQGTADVAQPVRATKPPERRHPQVPLVRAVTQAMSPTGQPRPLADFLAPVVEIAAAQCHGNLGPGRHCPQ